MPQQEAVFHQASFLEGEWSALAQGRSDLPSYKMAMNVCLNGLPVIQGAWVRRSGTRYLGPTIDRAYSKQLSFVPSSGIGYVFELGNLKLRFLTGADRVTTDDDRLVTASSSSGGILSLTLDAVHGWVTGDFVFIELNGTEAADAGLYLNRLMKVASTPTTAKLTLKDDTGTVFSFNSADDVLVGATVKRVKQFTTSWGSAVLPGLRLVQAENDAVILCGSVAPYALSITGTTFSSLAAVAFRDGPFLESQETDPDVLEGGAVSAYTGTVTFTPEASTFEASDVGRLIRLFHQPAEWDAGTTYAYGDFSTYQDEWWMSIAQGDYATANVGQVPGALSTVSGSSVVLWTPAPEAGRWAWGTIATQSSVTCSVALETDLNSDNPLAITEWRLGVYKSGQYPTCGAYHDGRLVLAGAVDNRIDLSKSNDPYNFSTTDKFGNVADDNAIPLLLNSGTQGSVKWLVSDDRGIIVGTAGGELVIAGDGGITPYNREVKRMSNFGCADVDVCRVGSSLVFVQRFNRNLVEYRPADFSTRFEGDVLNEQSKHISDALITGIAYQQAPTPVLWGTVSNTRSLFGITFRRKGPDVIAAAHRHEIADDDRHVAGICVGEGTVEDALHLVTYSVSSDDYALEILTRITPET